MSVHERVIAVSVLACPAHQTASCWQVRHAGLPRTRRLLPPLLPVVPPFRLVAASEAGVTRRTSALPARRYPLALSSFSTMLLQQRSTTASEGHTERSKQPLAASSSRAKMEPHRGASSQALTDGSDSAALSNLLKHGRIRAVKVRRMLAM